MAQEPTVKLFINDMSQSTMTDYVGSSKNSSAKLESISKEDSPILSSVPILTENTQFNMYDERLKKIESQMEAIMLCVRQLQTTVNDIQSQLGSKSNAMSEQKSNDIEILRKEIGNIKSKIIDPLQKNRNELKEWITNIVQLPEYYDIFIYNGIEDLSTVKLININTLKQMGVDKIGHQMKILHKVQQLNSGINQSMNAPQISAYSNPKNIDYAEGNVLVETQR